MAAAGQLDSTFANNGIFTDKFNSATGAASAVALQSDGKIVVGGVMGVSNSTGSRGVVVRLNTNGSFDSSFGTSGFVSLFPATPGPLVVQSDGKIVLVEPSSGNVNNPAPQMQRFDANGQRDATFGSGGSVALVFGGSVVALQSNGKFLIATGGPGSSTLVRYNSNGTLDTTFGIAGQESTVAAPGFVLQSDGRIATAGSVTTKTSLTGNTSGFGLMRLNTNGTTDLTFGTRGGVATPFPIFLTSAAASVVVQSNGDLVAGGSAATSGNTPASFALARYLGTGKLDTTFGSGGLVTTSFGGTTTAGISALVIQTDGKIVAAGSDSAGDLVVARYLGQ